MDQKISSTAYKNQTSPVKCSLSKGAWILARSGSWSRLCKKAGAEYPSSRTTNIKSALLVAFPNVDRPAACPTSISLCPGGAAGAAAHGWKQRNLNASLTSLVRSPKGKRMAKKGAAPKRPLLGTHMSIAGGVDKALLLGKEVGCDTVQIFTKSSRQWASKPLSKDEIAAFHTAKRLTGLTTVIAHDSYLYNFAAVDESLRRKSVNGLIDEIERCEAVGVAYLIA